MSTTRFYKLPADLAARSDLPGNAKVLLAVIADKIGGNAAAWPGARKLARAAGVSVEAVIQNVVKLEAAGLLAVERRDNGRSNRYTLPDTQPNGAESAQEGSALSEAPKKAERPRKPNTGAQESGALAPKKAERIQTDPLSRGGAASPPAAAEPSGTGSDGAAGRIMGQWVDGWTAATGRAFPNGARGRTAGTLARLLADTDETTLGAAVGAWFGRPRETYSVGLFARKLEDGDADVRAPRTPTATPSAGLVQCHADLYRQEAEA